MLPRTLRHYFYGTALTFAVSFVSIPVILKSAGASVWLTIVIAQTYGLVGGLVVDYGYGFSGSGKTGSKIPADRIIDFIESVKVRLMFLATALVTVFFWLIHFADKTGTAFFLITFNYLIQSFTSAWYLQAEKRSDLVLQLIYVPRAISNLLASTSFFLHDKLIIYALILVSFQLYSIFRVVNYARLRVRILGVTVTWKMRINLDVFRKQFSSNLVALCQAFLLHCPLIIIDLNVDETKYVAQFALADRLCKYLYGSLFPIIQYFQTIVPGQDRSNLSSRLSKSIRIGAITSMVITVLCLMVFPPLAVVLSNGKISLEASVYVPFALTVGAIFFSNLVLTVYFSIHDRHKKVSKYVVSILFLFVLTFSLASARDSLTILPMLYAAAYISFCAVSLYLATPGQFKFYRSDRK